MHTGRFQQLLLRKWLILLVKYIYIHNNDNRHNGNNNQMKIKACTFLFVVYFLILKVGVLIHNMLKKSAIYFNPDFVGEARWWTFIDIIIHRNCYYCYHYIHFNCLAAKWSDVKSTHNYEYFTIISLSSNDWENLIGQESWKMNKYQINIQTVVPHIWVIIWIFFKIR